MTGSEYLKRQDGDATVFEVTPAKPPRFWLMIGFGVVLVLVGLGTGGGGLVAFGGMGAFCLWYGWSRDQRPKPHRARRTFRVTAAGIESDGRSFKRDDIHRLIIKNPFADVEVTVSGGIPTGVAAGLARRSAIQRICHSLDLEAGGKAHLLAGGMDDTTAYGLLADVSKIIGLQVS
jgi:hypothetical protein